MKCVWMVSYPCKISVERQYHVTEGGIDGAARSKLAYLATIYKIAPRSILIRAVPEEEYWNQCVLAHCSYFRERIQKEADTMR